jgi:FkbM family methyltransferase
MYMPLSHGLPIYYKHKPLYDRLPGKISAYLMEHQGHVTCIDIGANIGDTVAAFRVSEANRFLAIEPNPHFMSYLDKNWQHERNVVALSVVCSSGNLKSNFVIDEQNGTARISISGQGAPMEQMTLDEILTRNPGFEGANVLKIDTDGYDLLILPGAELLIHRNKPIVLFECDAFESKTYIKDFFNCIDIFRRAGYESLLLYDNYGNLIGLFQINGPEFDSFLTSLLRWQDETRIVYYDVLFLHGDELKGFVRENYSFLPLLT